jgi:hypothetical protein
MALDWILERFSTKDKIFINYKNVNRTLWINYCYSSWLYSFAGLYFFLLAYYYKPRYYGQYIDSILLITQGVLSYLSDVRFLGKTHYTRVFDRLVAIGITLRFFVVFFYYNDCYQNILLIIGFPASMYCYYRSYNARQYCYPIYTSFYYNQSIESYLKWHALWHVGFPLSLSIWISYIYYKNLNI